MKIEEKIQEFYRSEINDEAQLDQQIHQILKLLLWQNFRELYDCSLTRFASQPG